MYENNKICEKRVRFFGTHTVHREERVSFTGRFIVKSTRWQWHIRRVKPVILHVFNGKKSVYSNHFL